VTRCRCDGFPGSAGPPPSSIKGLPPSVIGGLPPSAIGGWHPEQRLTVAEVVRAYTLGAAKSVGMANRMGSLAPGKLADLVVLDRDIFTCDPMEIAETKVVATMIGGQFVYGEYGELPGS
jgi:N-acyl-D-aspartate/D-glutamate deacylase